MFPLWVVLKDDTNTRDLLIGSLEEFRWCVVLSPLLTSTPASCELNGCTAPPLALLVVGLLGICRDMYIPSGHGEYVGKKIFI